PLTGHVAYSYDCERWRHGCGSCPYLGEYPRLGRDTTAALFRWKNAVYRRSRITVVAPSRWLERIARASPLLGRFDVRRIPNGVDLDVFRPREDARRALGLDPDRPVVLFSSLERNDRRKGGEVLAAALDSLGDVDFQLAVLGPNTDGFDRPVKALGTLHDDERLALAYSAADVFVIPALAENLPNVAVESIACGTPVVASNVGGIPDAIRDRETGLLVPPGEAGMLADGIRLLLEDDGLRTRLGERARIVAESEFGAAREVREFAALYEELLAP
ncbi:MAG: putative Glycosyl transferase, group 1, partial [Myxococcales bacterium]|nr:putative Glycosyl transferase, group 1 [Myxococcales bacterium]